MIQDTLETHFLVVIRNTTPNAFQETSPELFRSHSIQDSEASLGVVCLVCLETLADELIGFVQDLGCELIFSLVAALSGLAGLVADFS